MTRGPEFEKARAEAAAFIGITASKSSGRVRQNLLKKGFDKAMADQAVLYFIERGYIDDERAADAIARRYQGRKLRSQRMMAQVFIQNGIDRDLACRAAGRLPDDRETALELCRAQSSSDEETLLKLLLRRGYPHGLAREAVKNHMKKENE